MCSKRLTLPLKALPWGDYLCQEQFFFRPRQAPLELEKSVGLISSQTLKTHPQLLENSPSRESSSGLEAFIDHLHALAKADQPLHIEYCSGHGHWITQQALKHPNIEWLAVEMKLSRACKILAKKRALQLKNLTIVCCQAQWFTRHFLPCESTHRIFIHFPDPWPRERHVGHRLMSVEFVDELERILTSKIPQGEREAQALLPPPSRPQASDISSLPTVNLEKLKDSQICIVTDDLTYCDQASALMIASRGLYSELRAEAIEKEPIHPKDHLSVYRYGILPGAYGGSYFETLWRSLGREIYILAFSKRAS